MWSSFCLAMSSIESGGPSSGLYGGGKNFEDSPNDADTDILQHQHGTAVRVLGHRCLLCNFTKTEVLLQYTTP
jgi:hypothetical protein